MGLFKKIKEGLKKTRATVVSQIDSMLKSFTKIDEELFEELTELLVMGDVGISTAEQITDELRVRVKKQGITDPKEINRLLEEVVADIFTRVNSGGVKLTENDFILTLISVNEPSLRDNIELFCSENKNSKVKLMNLEPKHIIRVAMAYVFKRARLKYAYQVLRGIELKRGSNKVENVEAKRRAFELLNVGLNNVLNIKN